MSRQLRLQYPGAWYHVMNRGLNRRRIFHTDDQRHIFFRLLADIHSRYGVQTHAYCLMDNHYHLLLYTPQANLSSAMRYLDGVYTQRFNYQERRDGSLFRGRYKAILVEAENYVLQLSRYIHLNPVSAKMCMRPEASRWSSYKAYIGQVKKPEWLYCEEVLSRCSEKLSIKEYRQFVEDGIDTELVEIFSRTRLPSVLGSQEWIEKLKVHCMAARVVDAQIIGSKDLVQWERPDDITALMHPIADYYGITLEALKQRGSRYAENKARNWLVYLAVVFGGFENKQIVDSIGGITVAGISQIKRRMHKKLEGNKALQVELEVLRRICGLMSNVML